MELLPMMMFVLCVDLVAIVVKLLAVILAREVLVIAV